MPIDLTISIINHSNPALLRECLRSLFAGTRDVTLDVWVVDNATGGAGVAEMQAEFPHVRWLFNAARQGFSANHNQVLCQATGRYACILNDDTVIHDGAFDTLVKFLDDNPKVGMAGAKLLNEDGTIQNCTFHFPTPLSEMIEICSLPASLCPLKARSIDPVQHHEQSALVDWVLGACLVVRNIALKQIGLLDAVLSPIANTEEVDWCKRARMSGWQVAYCPAAVLTHYGGQSLKSEAAGADRMRVEMYRTKIAYFRKHHGRFQAGLVRLIYSATLPWNALMLTQSLVRRRLSTPLYKRSLATLYDISRMSLFAHRRSCRA